MIAPAFDDLPNHAGCQQIYSQIEQFVATKKVVFEGDKLQCFLDETKAKYERKVEARVRLQARENGENGRSHPRKQHQMTNNVHRLCAKYKIRYALKKRPLLRQPPHWEKSQGNENGRTPQNELFRLKGFFTQITGQSTAENHSGLFQTLMYHGHSIHNPRHTARHLKRTDRRT
jgi:hypothetical protein